MKLCLIMGMGVTGKSVCNYLIANNYLPVFYDDKFSNLEDYKKIIKKFKLVITSPTIKANHELLVVAKAYGIKILNEIDFAFLNIKLHTNLIGVTGTNGKTTVVSMLEYLLGEKYKACGNIGLPIIKCVNNHENNLIVELSSFQLAGCKYFKPHIACILNLKPDHLDFHSCEKDYYSAKLNIAKNLTKEDFLVLNCEDSNIQNLKIESQAQIYYFGFNNKNKGCYIKNNEIYFRNADGTSQLLVNNLNRQNSLVHNLYNIMAVCTILRLMGYDFKNINKIINSYKYQPYRLEFIQEYNGVEVYNDSKATNVAAVQSALNCFKEKRVCLILGGVDKNESFCELFKRKNIKCVYVYGSSANKIIKDADEVGFKDYILCNGLEEVTRLAVGTKNIDVILFSPGCSSLDMFNSYEERGTAFNNYLKQILH